LNQIQNLTNSELEVM